MSQLRVIASSRPKTYLLIDVEGSILENMSFFQFARSFNQF